MYLSNKNITYTCGPAKNSLKSNQNGVDQWFPTFFDGGPNLIFQVSWRATGLRLEVLGLGLEVSSTLSCLHDGRLRDPSAHTSSFKRIWEVYPVASFEFYKKASQRPKSALCSPPKPKSIRLGEPLPCSNFIFSFFSTTTLPNPPRT